MELKINETAAAADKFNKAMEAYGNDADFYRANSFHIAHLGNPYLVLDQGIVRVLDSMGSDASICSAARVSYAAGTKTVNDDRSLLRYLLRHGHTSPFEMCELKLHLKMPIFVARQWVRHRTASLNEISGRYSIIRDEFYVPSEDMVSFQSDSNKQGRGGPLDVSEAEEVQGIIADAGVSAFRDYGELVEERKVARELARVVLPVSTYTEFVWKIDLHNLLHFLKLRLNPHAQDEIRAYAEVIWQLVKDWVPDTADAFVDYELNAVKLSATVWLVLWEHIPVNVTDSLTIEYLVDSMGISKREAQDFLDSIPVTHGGQYFPRE